MQDTDVYQSLDERGRLSVPTAGLHNQKPSKSEVAALPPTPDSRAVLQSRLPLPSRIRVHPGSRAKDWSTAQVLCSTIINFYQIVIFVMR
jgi:hypothetical protein